MPSIKALLVLLQRPRRSGWHPMASPQNALCGRVCWSKDGSWCRSKETETASFVPCLCPRMVTSEVTKSWGTQPSGRWGATLSCMKNSSTKTRPWVSRTTVTGWAAMGCGRTITWCWLCADSCGAPSGLSCRLVLWFRSNPRISQSAGTSRLDTTWVTTSLLPPWSARDDTQVSETKIN